jgi:RND family efflux transporter MFP subunit
MELLMQHVFSTGRSLAALCFVILITTSLGTGCKKRQAPPPPPPPAVSVLNPIEREVVEWDEFTGKVEAVHVVNVRARVSGMLEKADFLEGSVVKEGDLLFALDRRPFEAAVQQSQGDLERAQAQFALAEVEFKRLDELRASNAVSGTEYETQREKVAQGRASITSAQGALAAAKLNLEWAEVRAPITGKVDRALVKPGNFVTGGEGTATALTTITSTDPMYCIIDADERSILKYQRLALSNVRVSARDAKIPAYLSLADENTYERQGMVDFVSNRLNPNTGTLLARATFDNKDGFLKDGMFARVRVPGSGAYKAILIPGEAVGTDQAQKFVFVVDDEGTAQPRPVKLGADFDGFRVVTSGLTTADRVVVNGLMKVRPGAKVKAETVPWPDRPMHIAPHVNPNGSATTKPATAPTASTTGAPAGTPNAPGATQDVPAEAGTPTEGGAR